MAFARCVLHLFHFPFLFIFFKFLPRFPSRFFRSDFMAKQQKKPSSRRTVPRKMARPKRDLTPPLWAVVCGLILLAGGLAAWFWRPMPTYHATEGEVVTPAWKAGPEDVDAFADTMAVQARLTLIGLGVPDEVIKVVKLPANRGSHMRWEVRSDVPGVIPLAVCNLAMTRLAQRLGGAVLEGREDRLGDLLSLRVGLGDQGTTLVTLKKNAKLKRRAGRIAIIIDDFGYQDQGLISKFCHLPCPITLSIFPREKHTEWIAQQAVANGKGVMVHLPMEPIDYPARDPGPNAIFTDYAPERIRALTHEGLLAVPGAQGVNNHMGSRVTENANAMQAVLQEVKLQGFFFVDSATSPRSIAYEEAQEAGIPSGRNALFLDYNEATEAVLKKLFALGERARHEGTAIGIGHAKPGTLEALVQGLPELQKEGFEFILAKDAVR